MEKDSMDLISQASEVHYGQAGMEVTSFVLDRPSYLR